MTKGLTLIELLIVIALLGVLSLLTIGMVLNTQLIKGRDAKRKVDLQTYSMNFEEYYDTAGCYPSTLPPCRNALLFGSEIYIQNSPCDPRSQSQYSYINDASYCPNWYAIYTNLENENDVRIEEAGCVTGCGPDCAYNYGVSSPNKTLDRCTPSVTPSPTPIQYVCGPGGGQTGICEAYNDPALSECPKVYPNDPTCNNECSEHENRCKNASGKTTPD